MCTILKFFRAFGWTPPHFGHLPLILNSDGSKLSKRQDNIRVEYYRQNGIFPVALINYITTTGGGFEREQGTQECYNYEDLIKQVIFFFCKFFYSTSRYLYNYIKIKLFSVCC